MAAQLPENPCFRAVVIAGSEIELQWRVVNSTSTVHIYSDVGTSKLAVGDKPAFCRVNSWNVCSTPVTVPRGGYYRWILRVEHSSGRQIYVPAAITVAAPFAPIITAGGGLVDMLSPTRKEISWVTDSRNRNFSEDIKGGWIELRQPKELWFSPDRLPRSGPEASFTVPASTFKKPGRYNYAVRECLRIGGSNSKICSPGTPAGFTVGSDRFRTLNPTYALQSSDLDVAFTTVSGDVRRLYSKTLIPQMDGQGYLETADSTFTIDGSRLTPGTHVLELASCQSQTGRCTAKTKLKVLVRGSVAPILWTLGRDYTEDFHAGHAYPEYGAGEPLDIAYDERGGIWAINEFSTSVEHVTPDGTVETFTIPLKRNPLPGSRSEAVKPFTTRVGNTGDKPATYSALGERAARIGSTVWFTQGGAMLASAKMRNHSRVIAFDPALSDLPTTSFDDRLCVYNIPTDDEKGYGDNQIVGLTASKGRIWIGESRGFYNRLPSVISAFVADTRNCDNLLDFDNPGELSQQRMQYCAEGITAQQGGCVEKYSLKDLPAGIKVAHLETDPIDGSVWFTDAHGGYLGNLDPDRPEQFKIYPLDDPHTGLNWFGGFPWSIRVDAEAVYFAEFTTRSLLRFDKATEKFDEILVPVRSPQARLHSIDIDATTNRLWFTLTNGAPTPLVKAVSTIGYVDLNSWKEHVVQPQTGVPVYATLYKGLDKIDASSTYPNQQQSFRGIAVDPQSGKIVLATMRRNQLTELTPKARFRPKVDALRTEVLER